MEHVTTRLRMADGAELNLLSAGCGPTLLMLPGWSQTAAMFKHQLSGLSDAMHVMALDPRGHGDSSNAPDGYTIEQFADDLHSVIDQLGLKDITLLGHSLSNTVFWSYLHTHQDHRIKRLVIADQSPVLCLARTGSPEERLESGVIFTPDQLEEHCAALKASAEADDGGEQARSFTADMIKPMFSPGLAEAEFAWAVEENLKFPRELAARLLNDGSLHDWRAIIPTLDIPTLVIGGRKSVVPWQSQAWIGSSIPGARTVILEEDELGYHFAFMENPERFNREVLAFCIGS